MKKLSLAYFFSLLIYLNASVGIFYICCMLGIKILISSPREDIVQDALLAKQNAFGKCKFVLHIMFSSKKINTLLHSFHLLFSFNRMRHISFVFFFRDRSCSYFHRWKTALEGAVQFVFAINVVCWNWIRNELLDLHFV